jgi:uncharacterized tellurite resistance protein B-like protein
MAKTPYFSGDEAPANTAAASTLRGYPANGPQARARLIALALLADGRLDSSELEDLGRRSAYNRLGLSREDFFQVLCDFCNDVSATPNRGDDYLITPAMLERMFAEITEPAQRQALLRQILEVIRSDGRLATGEARLFWNAVDAWKLAREAALGGLRGRKLRRRPGQPAPAIP